MPQNMNDVPNPPQASEHTIGERVGSFIDNVLLRYVTIANRADRRAQRLSRETITLIALVTIDLIFFLILLRIDPNARGSDFMLNLFTELAGIILFYFLFYFLLGNFRSLDDDTNKRIDNKLDSMMNTVTAKLDTLDARVERIETQPSRPSEQAKAKLDDDIEVKND